MYCDIVLLIVDIGVLLRAVRRLGTDQRSWSPRQCANPMRPRTCGICDHCGLLCLHYLGHGHCCACGACWPVTGVPETQQTTWKTTTIRSRTHKRRPDWLVGRAVPMHQRSRSKSCSGKPRQQETRNKILDHYATT